MELKAAVQKTPATAGIALEIAGRLADGTVTWMTGPNTLRDHVVPRLRESAAAAGNPPPRVCVGMPVAVTDHPDRARARADRLFQHYAVLPSYRSMLEREGVEGPGDIAIVDSEEAVESHLRHLAEMGATDLLATIFPVDGSQTSVTRTRALLQNLVGRI